MQTLNAKIMSKVTVKKGGETKLEKHVIVVETLPGRVQSAGVSDWRNAVNSAKAGYCNPLFRLYENILSDGVLSEAIEKRTQAITNSEITFLNAQGEPVEAVNKVIDSVGFENLLIAIMEAKAWGISVIDIMGVMPELEIYNVPRRNLLPAKKMVVASEGDQSGLPYEDNPFIIEVLNHSDPLGYIYKAAPYVIYKRGGFGDWAEFAEIFGMPFRAWKYSAYDTTVRDELINALQKAGSRLNMVVPKEAELEQKEASGNSDGALFDKLIDRCEKEILIAVLGETMTTVDGSSKSQSETHKDVAEEKNKSDRRFARRVLNSQVKPIFEMFGLAEAGGSFTFPEQGEALSTEKRVEMSLKVRRAGIPVSNEYIYEISGIRMPKDGETVTSEAPAFPDAGNGNDPDDEPEDGKTKKPGKKVEASLMRRFISFFAEALSGERAPLKY